MYLFKLYNWCNYYAKRWTEYSNTENDILPRYIDLEKGKYYLEIDEQNKNNYVKSREPELIHRTYYN